MINERRCVFSSFLDNSESIKVHQDQKSVTHFLNFDLVQKLSLGLDDKNNCPILFYDKFKDGLWARLVIYPNFPITQLGQFYVGRKNIRGFWQGVSYTRGDLFPMFYSEESENPTRSPLNGGDPINWKQMGSSKEFDFNGAYVTNYIKENDSFFARLVPSLYAPIAQISLSEDFEREKTLTVDTSYFISTQSFNAIFSMGEATLGSQVISPENASQFCLLLEDTFEPFFPDI